MLKFTVQTREQLAAAFRALIGQYEAATIVFSPLKGGTMTYKFPNVVKESALRKVNRDKRLGQYAKNAGKT